MKKPRYNKIYFDLIERKFPEKLEECRVILAKDELSVLDIISLNKKLFGTKNRESEECNQKLRSYDESTILKILAYQRKNKLNNSQLAIHFKMSRNTVTKWKKLYLVAGTQLR